MPHIESLMSGFHGYMGTVIAFYAVGMFIEITFELGMLLWF